MNDFITPWQLDTKLYTAAAEAERQWRKAVSDLERRLNDVEQRLEKRIHDLDMRKPDKWSAALDMLLIVYGVMCIVFVVLIIVAAHASR